MTSATIAVTPRVTSAVRDHVYILLALSFFVGTLFTLRNYATIGIVNQTEDLPQILRMIDENYLVNDHFVNSSTANFSIRFYYNSVMAMLISLLGLPIAFFATCLAINIATIFCTAWFAYKLFQDDLGAGMISGLLIHRTSFVIAGGYNILTDQTVANYLCMILVYVAFFHVIIRRRLILGAFFLGIASLMQPLSAIIAFGLCLAGTVFADLFYDQRQWIKAIRDWQLWRKVALSILVFGSLLALIIVPYMAVSAGELSDREFVQIYGYFRVPHHAIPSYFLSFNALIKIALFFLIIATSLLISDKIVQSRRTRLFAIGAAIAMVLLGLGNYVFVEVIPTRLFVTLVPIMKLSTIVAWFGTILIAGVISQPQINIKRVGVLLLIVVYYALVERAELIAAAVVAIMAINSAIAFGLIPQRFVPSQRTGRFLLIGGAVALVGLVVASRLIGVSTDRGLYLRDIRQDVQKLQGKISGQAPVHQELFDFAKQKTEEDAVFIAPPNMGDFRLFASRATVALSKTYPANDQGLHEWYVRLSDMSNCENGVLQAPLIGSMDLATVDANYAQIDDACLALLHEKYAADYAVLHRETPINFPILYCGAHYKVARLDGDNLADTSAIVECNPTQ